MCVASIMPKSPTVFPGFFRALKAANAVNSDPESSTAIDISVGGWNDAKEDLDGESCKPCPFVWF
jgi:hypothetical protein